MLFNVLVSVIRHPREGGSLSTLLATVLSTMIGRNGRTFLSKSFLRGAIIGVLTRVASPHRFPRPARSVVRQTVLRGLLARPVPRRLRREDPGDFWAYALVHALLPMGVAGAIRNRVSRDEQGFEEGMADYLTTEKSA